MTSSSVQPSLIQTAYEQMESTYNHATLFMKQEVDPIISAFVMSRPRDSAVKTTMVALQLLGTFFILSALCSAAAPLPILGRVISLLPIPLFSTYSGILPKLYTVLAFAIGHDLLKLVQNKKERKFRLSSDAGDITLDLDKDLVGSFACSFKQQNQLISKTDLAAVTLQNFAQNFLKGTLLPFLWNSTIRNCVTIHFHKTFKASISRTSRSK